MERLPAPVCRIKLSQLSNRSRRAQVANVHDKHHPYHDHFCTKVIEFLRRNVWRPFIYPCRSVAEVAGRMVPASPRGADPLIAPQAIHADGLRFLWRWQLAGAQLFLDGKRRGTTDLSTINLFRCWPAGPDCYCRTAGAGRISSRPRAQGSPTTGLKKRPWIPPRFLSASRFVVDDRGRGHADQGLPLRCRDQAARCRDDHGFHDSRRQACGWPGSEFDALGDFSLAFWRRDRRGCGAFDRSPSRDWRFVALRFSARSGSGCSTAQIGKVARAVERMTRLTRRKASLDGLFRSETPVEPRHVHGYQNADPPE